jgi:3-oxoacyl-[acyl-carrier protein] reductase
MGRVAIVGATGTVGRTLAKRLASKGTALLLVGRSEDKLAALSAEIGAPSVQTECERAAPLEAALRPFAAMPGDISAIVNCVGSVLLKPAHLTSDDEFAQVVQTNLMTAFATVHVAGKLLREGGGSVVLFASAAAEIGMTNHEAIAAAKGGVIALGRSAAATYAPNNIRVNVISPGLVKTDMTRRLWEVPANAAVSMQMHPLGRLGEPNHVASAVEWLLQPESDWITGQVIGVDGGLGHLLPRKKA